MYVCAQMVNRCVNARADFESDQILSHHGDVHTIAMALNPTQSNRGIRCTVDVVATQAVATYTTVTLRQ